MHLRLKGGSAAQSGPYQFVFQVWAEGLLLGKGNLRLVDLRLAELVTHLLQVKASTQESLCVTVALLRLRCLQKLLAVSFEGRHCFKIGLV